MLKSLRIRGPINGPERVDEGKAVFAIATGRFSKKHAKPTEIFFGEMPANLF